MTCDCDGSPTAFLLLAGKTSKITKGGSLRIPRSFHGRRSVRIRWWQRDDNEVAQGADDLRFAIDEPFIDRAKAAAYGACPINFVRRRQLPLLSHRTLIELSLCKRSTNFVRAGLNFAGAAFSVDIAAARRKLCTLPVHLLPSWQQRPAATSSQPKVIIGSPMHLLPHRASFLSGHRQKFHGRVCIVDHSNLR